MRVTYSHRRHFICTIRILLRLHCLHGVISKDSFNLIYRQKRFCKKVGKTPLSKTPFFGANPTANPTGILNRSVLRQKVRKTPDFLSKSGGFYGCGGRTRTYDLRVMSPTSFQLLYSAISYSLGECSGIISQHRRFVNCFSQVF